MMVEMGFKRYIPLLFLSFMLFFVACVPIINPSGTAFTVCSSGCDYKNINDALIALNNTNSSIYLMENGSYTMNNGMYVLGGDSPKLTIIGIMNDNITLDCNGSFIISKYAEADRIAIFIHNSTNITIKSCTIVNSSTAIKTNEESKNVSIVNNTIVFSGNGIELYSNGSAAINNSINAHFGISIKSFDNVVTNNSIIANESYGLLYANARNISPIFGGGIIFAGANKRNNVSNNKISASNPTITNITFGIALLENNTDNLIENNSINLVNASIVLVNNNEEVVVFGNSFIGNVLYANNIGIGANANFSIENNTFINNTIYLNLNAKSLNIIEFQNKTINASGIYLGGNFTFNNFSGNVLYTPRNITDVFINDENVSNNSFWENEFYGNGVNDAFLNNTYNVSNVGNYYSCNAKYIPATDPDFYRVVIDDCHVNQNLTLLNKTYHISESSNGIIIFNSSNLTLDCNGATLIGNGSGIGIISHFYNNTIKNCNVFNYSNGIVISHNASTILNNTLNYNNAGLNVSGYSSFVRILNNTIRFNSIGIEI